MAFNPNGYQTLYGFNMLDEAHNFMPELLYDEQLFPQVPLMWIRHRLRTLFPTVFVRQQNLYTMYQSAERRTAFNRWYNTIETPAPPNIAIPTVTASMTTPIRSPPAVVSPPHVRGARRARHDPIAEFTNIGLTSLILEGLINNTPTTNFMFDTHHDVPVLPTARQISAGSTSVSLTDVPTDTACAVCQERGDDAEEWRKLHCGHFFHNRCIVQWFERGAFCPVCRADVREPPAAVQT